ncbi:MAG TPA: LptF/LptG family permease [Chitinophagaceae bacterium]|nr:LptF/LptG family permease [Chitinophagaceae bacterium]
MFKKLDKLIIKAFVGPFVAVFFLTLLVLVLQFFWLWIDDFVGKGLSASIISEFIWYQSAALVPLALPLAVLLSSLMTFGNLGESFELVAVKSAGISLLRFMRPLFFVSILICGIAFLFSNFIIPVAVLKSQTLLGDIVWAKPAFDIKEGVFYDKIDGFAIKIGKKEADSLITDVIIYEKGSNYLQDNFIIAKSGIMRTTTNRRYLEFNLKDGWRYQERGDRLEQNTEFIRIGFKEFTKQFDLSSLGLQQRTSDTSNRTNQRMQSMRQLSKSIDSLARDARNYTERIKRDVFSNYSFSGYPDSSYKKPDISKKPKIKKFEDLVPASDIKQVNQKAAAQVGTIGLNVEVLVSEYNAKQRDLRLHKIEWHKKITLSAACLVLFLIGAPLGSIIRKGGLGTPLVFAVFLFMFFFFFNTTGEKYVKENVMTPFGGMWMATITMVPVGIFLTYKAMHDSQLLNKEFYFRIGRKIRKYFKLH